LPESESQTYVPEVEDFNRAIQPLLETYRSIEIRVVADRARGEAWRLLRLRALLVPDGRIEMLPDLPRLPDLVAVQESRPISELDDFLADLEAGEVDVGGTPVLVRQDVGNNTQRPLDFHGRTYDRVASFAEFQVDHSTIVLHGWGSIPNSMSWSRNRDRLGSALRHAAPPWDGLDELYRGFIEEATRPPRLETIEASVIAPLPLRFKEVRIETQLTAEVEPFPTADPAFGSLGVLFTMGGKTAKRARVPLEGATLRGSGVYVVTMPFTEAVHGVSCFLTYRGLDADRRDLFRTGPGGPPRSWAVLGRNVGTPDDLLVKLLEMNGDPLEHGVAVLFHLLGFSVVHPGRHAFNPDAADILAFGPGGELLCVIETTARERDMVATVEKLAARTKEILQDLPHQRAIPVLVTNQPRGAITEGALKQARSDKVALVTADELRRLVALSTGNPPATFVLDQVLSRLIPGEYS